MTRRAARPIRRSHDTGGWRGLLTRVRVAGLILAVGTAGTIGWLVTDDQFSLRRGSVQISGLQYSDAAAVDAAIGIPLEHPNVFLLHTEAMRGRLLALPAVSDADVHVLLLPSGLVVNLTERTAVLELVHDGLTYLLDGNGLVLGGRSDDVPTNLPLIYDQRVALSIALDVGQPIDPTEATAMLEIGAITQSLVGSAAPQLSFSVDDNDGFVVSAGPDAWRAVFGFYTPTLRPPSEIAQQVQCLRSLLAAGESAIDTIYLAPQDDRCGTYLPRPS